jgi:hypothetical protein
MIGSRVLWVPEAVPVPGTYSFFWILPCVLPRYDCDDSADMMVVRTIVLVAIMKGANNILI